MGDNGNRDPVAISIEDKFTPLPTPSPDCCIYRVPENLREVNEEAYRPLVVSIGPFYHNDPKLQPTQKHKLIYLQSFLRRNGARNMDDYIRVIRQKQQDVRDCYAEQVNLDDNTFIEMVFVDAAFIIELFLQHYCFIHNITEADSICVKDWVIELVDRDIKLEENQLPFFILNEVYNLASLSFPPFISLTYLFLTGRVDPIPDKIARADIQHFVDFLRVYHLPSALRRESNPREKYVFPPRVTKLSEAGVTIKKSKSKNLLDISFTNGALEIPKLMVDGDTETIFRNIMVFEQLHHFSNSYIIDYISFLDDLIDTQKDVEILIEKGILVDWLGSNKDVAKLFNNINNQIFVNSGKFYYSGVCKNLNAHVNSRCHRWKAILKHKYFNHPWAAISVFYAILILILAILQVITGFTKK